MSLQPKHYTHAKVVTTKTTKANRKYWKRNVEKSCGVSLLSSTTLQAEDRVSSLAH